MAVFSPLDTNVIPGFQYSSAATPVSSFPQGGARAALASWSKKPAEQTASTPSGIYALDLRKGNEKAFQINCVIQSVTKNAGRVRLAHCLMYIVQSQSVHTYHHNQVNSLKQKIPCVAHRILLLV